ncbi:MAG: T9SS type A sorting domain-containing protein [bacterium]
MKQKSFILAFLLCSCIVYSQVNYPLITPDKIWSIVDQDPHGGATITTAYKFENDTIFNGESYYLVYECYLDSTLSNWSIYQNCFIREDTLGNVYKLVNNVELMIYGFSLEVGDSVFTGRQIAGQDVYAEVDTVDYVLINGDLRKRIVFDAYFYEIWIEGIVSLTHILFPFSRLTTFYFDLLCVNDSGNIIYQNAQFEDCYVYIVGITERDNHILKVKISPNPLKDQSIVEIEDPDPGKRQIHLVNSLGKIMRTITFYGNKCMVKKDGLSPGLYLVKLTSSNSYHCTRLIVE